MLEKPLASMKLIVTSLPDVGELYTTSDGVTPELKIAIPGDALHSDGGHVAEFLFYVDAEDACPARTGVATNSFAVAAVDKFGTSEEALVHIAIVFEFCGRARKGVPTLVGRSEPNQGHL